MVTLHTTVHDSCISLLCNALLGNLWVDPVWETPHAWVNLTKLHGATGVIRDGVLEGRVEVAIVQKDVGIMIPPVEVTLNRLDRLYNTIQLLISGQDNKCCVCSRLAGIYFKTSSGKDLVMFLADFPVTID